MKQRCTVVVGLMLLSGLTARAQITLQVSVEPAASLPAISPSVRVQATNNSTAPSVLPNRAALQVIRSNGPSFVAFTDERADRHTTALDQTATADLVLAPRETRDLTFWASTDGPPWFAADTRLYAPGTYRLRLLVSSDLRDEQLVECPLPQTFEGRPGVIVSNEAVFTIKNPEGADAAVWQLIKKQPLEWMNTLANVIWTQYPSSAYAGYVVRTKAGSTSEEKIAFYRDALARNPDPPFADWWHLVIAQLELKLMNDFIDGNDVEAAVQWSTAATQELERLVKFGHEPKLRQLASAELTHAYSREWITELRERKSGRGRLVADVCLETALNDQLFARYAYENPQASPIVIPIGVDNKFTGPPFDRGQPTSFAPGVHQNALRIPFEGPEMTWHLQKKDVRVTRNTPQCPEDAVETVTRK